MKKLIFTLLVMCISVIASAQSKKAEKKAKKAVEKMTEVLNLDQDTSAKIYQAKLDKLLKVEIIKTENKDDKNKMKKELSTVSAALQKEFETILGSDRLGTWNAYLKENKGKKHKKG
jgi:hypothetical protein